MASLEDSLANIPFYSAYTAKSQLNQQQGLGQIQQAAGLAGLLEKLQTQQRDQQLRQSLQESGGSAQAAYHAALKAGNTDAAAKLAPLVKVEQDADMAKQFAGMGNATPDQLDALGLRLGAAGHPGAATVMNIADKRRKLANDASTLGMMRDTPQGLTAGQTIDVGGKQVQLQEDIPAGDVAAFLRAQQGISGPGANSVPIEQRQPQQGDPTMMGGGALATLKNSQSPGIAQRAAYIQSLINNPNFKGDLSGIQKEIDNLTAMDVRNTEGRNTQAQRAADAMALREVVNSTRQPARPVAIVGPDGKPTYVSPGDALGKTPASSNDTASLQGDPLDMAASRYLMDGTLPPNMGRGAQGTANTVAVLTRASAMAKAKGMDGEATRISQLANKSISTALTGLERQRANIMTYEKTALAGADIALEMSNKVDRTGVPLVNKWVNAGRVALQGDVDVTRLNNAVETFANEYAKVMSGSSGGQATTVSMQEHARQMLSGAQTKEQFAGVIELMRREMTQTREKAFDAQIDEMKGRMGASGATNVAPAGDKSIAATAAPGKASAADFFR